jgi:hypothetical protein
MERHGRQRSSRGLAGLRAPFRRRRTRRLIAAATALSAAIVPVAVAQGSPAAPAPAVAQHGPTVILSKQRLASLGLGLAPDSIAARYTTPAGRTFLFFTGASAAHPRRGFDLYRLPLSDAQTLTAASVQSRPRMVLSPAGRDRPSYVSWCKGSSCFDANYTGGGTLLRCPGNGPLLTAYHAENHTDPSHRFLGRQGWSGIGLARWNPRSQSFVKIDQIIGVHASNTWHRAGGGWQTQQAPPVAFQGDMVLDPANGMVYLYYGDKNPTANPYRGIWIAVAAIRLRTLCADVKAGVHSVWRKWFRGSFSQPGVFTSSRNPQHLPAGTGGAFTPLNRDGSATSPNVLYDGGQWYMVTSNGHTEIDVRTSSDGLHWSSPRVLYRPAFGYVFYPYLWAPAGGGSTAYLTFSWHNADSAPTNWALEQVQLTL